jgi:hypothetical protein
MVNELLNHLESVGEGADVESAPRLPGTQLAYIAHDGDATVKVRLDIQTFKHSEVPKHSKYSNIQFQVT